MQSSNEEHIPGLLEKKSPTSVIFIGDAARSAAFSAAGGCALFKQTLDTLQPWAEQ